jgi:predicted small metal-binding protein
MKKMTCIELGGACEQEFTANSFQEMATLSKQHAIEMMKKGDKAHLDAMNDMQQKMQTPEEMNAWMESKLNLFNSLPDIG